MSNIYVFFSDLVCTSTKNHSKQIWHPMAFYNFSHTFYKFSGVASLLFLWINQTVLDEQVFSFLSLYYFSSLPSHAIETTYSIKNFIVSHLFSQTTCKFPSKYFSVISSNSPEHCIDTTFKAKAEINVPMTFTVKSVLLKI